MTKFIGIDSASFCVDPRAREPRLVALPVARLFLHSRASRRWLLLRINSPARLNRRQPRYKLLLRYIFMKGTPHLSSHLRLCGYIRTRVHSRCVYHSKLSAAARVTSSLSTVIHPFTKISPLSHAVFCFVFDFLAANSYVSGNIAAAPAAENNIIHEMKIIYDARERERERGGGSNERTNIEKPNMT